MPLEKLISVIENKEAGKRSSSRFTESHKTSAVKISYRRETNQPPWSYNQSTNQPPWSHNHNNGRYKDTKEENYSCDYCGKQNHGNFKDPGIRRKVCPAFNHTCKFCNQKGHYERLCRKKQEPHPRQPTTSLVSIDSQKSSFKSDEHVGSIQQQSSNIWDWQSIPIDHHLYDNLNQAWIKRKSQPQPMISLVVRVL